MSYTALYRKFRPQEFQDVKGQDHIVSTLKNQIEAQRIGHAYLFCGTRGTGKTTIAKIFAKAVNCEHPVDASPCGHCPTCEAIASGASMNVIEIDAASNNGVDSVRQIREEVSYSPPEGKYKVYIIDEVHMLSTAAFNALLKTLEEPPAYVIFILATTEANKLPITILSRCQRYDFRRITIETISNRLKELMKEEQVQVEEKAIRYIAKAADGSMRDALSLLDQCIAFNLGEELTYDKVLEVLGAVDTEVFARLLRHIESGETLKAIKLLEEMVYRGRELPVFVADFTWYLRNLLLLQSTDQMEDALDVSTENLMQMKEIAQQVEAATLIRYIKVFSTLLNDIRFSSQKRVLIEVAIIKLCRPQMEQNYDSLLQRISNLEKKIEQGNFTERLNATPQIQTEDISEEIEIPKAVPEDIKEVVSRWNEVMQDRNISPMKRGTFMQAHLSIAGNNGLRVSVQSGIIGHMESSKSELEAAIRSVIKKDVEVLIESMDNKTQANRNHGMNLQDMFGGMPIVEEDS
ncbi:DNA polymerase III subunit gamma/tau [Eubacterium oxidoreducens]|uniref:DNA-directed DNA polymerase n=1 Tax=Eubacterium oxidoreducens TaxID=1732 RepID=A0A1G6CRY8_EUBOX|nr:DNA polymerase III subunit gamma/tau [Eubacterium oxidoreducens]SDB35614.1 DNA polymerase-3 subunit gamma/tau [Eubacterium oxidoreducens]